jgi:cytochrome c-type biogenesis protein CcmH
MKILLTIAALAALWVAPAQAQTAIPTENDPVSARREHELASQLRCLVCQNQTIADSNADLAQDLRRQVREQIAAGRTDREIIDFMTARYGDFVLYQPPFKATTALLWLGPGLLLLTGGLVAVRIVRSRRGLAEEAQLTAAERERAEQLLRGRTPRADPS